MEDVFMGLLGILVLPMCIAMMAYVGNMVFLKKSFEDNIKDIKGLLIFIYLAIIVAICAAFLVRLLTN